MMDVSHDWELSKENIQPKREGRNFEVLNAVLSEEEKIRLAQQKELQQKAFENELLAYSGTDPLDVWVRYITWHEENFPQGKRGLKRIIINCLDKLRSAHQYINDRRLLRVWVKYCECSNSSAVELWSNLYGRQYFHRLAEFYSHWARALEEVGNMKDALATLKLAYQNGAEPKEVLEVAQKSLEDRFACSLVKTYLNEPDERAPVEEKRVPIAEIGTHGFSARAPVVRGGAPVGHVKVGPASGNSKKENLVIPVYKDENQPQDIISLIKAEEASLPVVKGATKENVQQAEKWTTPAAPQPSENPVVAIPSVPPATFKIYEDECNDPVSKPLSSAKKPAGVLRDKPVASSQPAPEALLQSGNKPTERIMCNLQAVYSGSAEYSFEQLRAKFYESKSSVKTTSTSPDQNVEEPRVAAVPRDEPAASSRPAPEALPQPASKPTERIMCNLQAVYSGTAEYSFEQLRAKFYENKSVKTCLPSIQTSEAPSSHGAETLSEPRVQTDGKSIGCTITPSEQSTEELRATMCTKRGLGDEARAPEEGATTTRIVCNPRIYGSVEVSFEELRFQYYQSQGRIPQAKEADTFIQMNTREPKSKDAEVQTDIAGLDLILHFTRPEPQISTTNRTLEVQPKANENTFDFAHSSRIPAPLQVRDPQVFEEPPEQVEPNTPCSSEPQQAKFPTFPLDVEPQDDHLPSPTVHSKAAKSLFREWLTQPVILKKPVPKTAAVKAGDTFEIYKDPVASEAQDVLQKTSESNAVKRLPLSDMAPLIKVDVEEQIQPAKNPEPFEIYVDPLPAEGHDEQKKQEAATKRVPLAVIASSKPEPEAQLKTADVEMEEIPQAPAPCRIPLVNMDKWDEYMNSDNEEPHADENLPPAGFKAPVSKRQISGVLVPSVDIPFDPEAQCEEMKEPVFAADAPKPARFLLNESTTQIISWQNNPFKEDFTVPSQAAFAAFARTTSTPFQQVKSGLGTAAVIEEDVTCKIIMKPREATVTSDVKTSVTEFKTPGANDAAAAARWTTKLLSPINEISREYYSSSSGSCGSSGSNSTSRFHKTIPRVDRLRTFPADYNPFDEAVRSGKLSSLEEPLFSRAGLVQIHGNESPLRESSLIRLGNCQYLIGRFVGRTSSSQIYSATEAQLSTEQSEVLLKLQSSFSGLWEFYIHDELHRRLQANRLDFLRQRVVRIQKTFLFDASSVSVLENVPQRSLAQVIRAYKASGKSMPESLVFFFVTEMLHMVKELHDCKIVHCDIKPENFVICSEPSLNYDNFCAEEVFTVKHQSLKLREFGRSLDLALYPEGTNFFYRFPPQDSCCEMIDEKPWSYQLDYYGLACTIYSMLTGEVCQVQQLRNEWCVPNMERVQATIWRQLTTALLNCAVFADGHVTAHLDSWLLKIIQEFFCSVKEREFRSAVDELKFQL